MARDFRVICVDNLETRSRMRPKDGRAVPTFVRQALEGKPLTVFGEGSQTRSFGREPVVA